MESWLIGAGVCGLVVGLILLPGFNMSRHKCPDCSGLLPSGPKPADGRPALWGGVTCPRCDWVDRRGRKIVIESMVLTEAKKCPASPRTAKIAPELKVSTNQHLRQ